MIVFSGFEEIAFLIIAFIECDRLGHNYQMYSYMYIARFKNCNLGKNSQSAIF